MRRTHRELSRGSAVLAACALLTACVTPRPAPTQYSQTVDSPSNFCRTHPLLCKPQPGEQLPSVPPPFSGPSSAALNIAAAAKVIQVVIDATLEAQIRQALKECADKARSDVMFQHFQRSPTREECLKVVEHDARGQPVTRAMLLGRLQHTAALQCAEQRLQQLTPGGFTLSARYRYNPATGETEFLSPEQVKALLAQGRAAELLGTIEPDVVIHLPGQPLHIQLVFDFKFPCVNTDQPIPWRKYPSGHPLQEVSQDSAYKLVLRVDPWRVQPHIGAFR